MFEVLTQTELSRDDDLPPPFGRSPGETRWEIHRHIAAHPAVRGEILVVSGSVSSGLRGAREVQGRAH